VNDESFERGAGVEGKGEVGVRGKMGERGGRGEVEMKCGGGVGMRGGGLMGTVRWG